MLLSAVCFAGMGVCVKFASLHFNASELVFYRGVISVVIMLAMLRGHDIEWRTQMPGQHLWRSAVGVFSLVTWFYALAYLQVRTLTHAGEPITRTVLFFSIATMITGAAGMGVQGVSPWNAQAAWWLLPLGVLSSAGQIFMTRGYSHGPTLVAANLHYSGIVFGALFSVAFFDDPITWWTWAGMAVILLSGIWATWLQESPPPPTCGDLNAHPPDHR